jgi:hypothetical protein
LAVILLLAGCATEPPPEPVKVAPVVTDTFCETAIKRTWSVKDTPETIREAGTWNRAIDKRCGVKRG